MSVQTDLVTFLLADAGISALVGTRIYPGGQLPQNPTLPAITYKLISGNWIQTATGAAGLAGPRMQIDCWAETYAGADALFELVRLRINGKGDGGNIQGMFLEGNRDVSDPVLGVRGRSADAFVWHEEATV